MAYKQRLAVSSECPLKLVLAFILETRTFRLTRDIELWDTHSVQADGDQRDIPAESNRYTN